MDPGETVTLVASAQDPEGDALSYAWSQRQGPRVALSHSEGPRVSFTAPEDGQDAELVFEVIVTDTYEGQDEGYDKVTVEGNEPPVVEPLSDQEVDSGETVKLQATAYDPDGDELTYAWQQDSGPRVPLDPSDQSELSFKAPTVQDKTELVLTLSVSAAQRSQHPAQPVQRDLRRSGHRQPQSGRQPGHGLGSRFGRQRAAQSTAAAAATTLLFLFNDANEPDPSVLLRLCATDGTLLQEASVAIAAQGSIVGTLSDLFGSSVEIDEGYVQVQSTLPLRGFDFLAGSDDFSSMTAQVGVQTRQLVVPRLFVDNHGGDTEIRLLNVGDTEALVQI